MYIWNKYIFCLYLKIGDQKIILHQKSLTEGQLTREKLQTLLPFPEENSQDFKISADRNLQMQTSSEIKKPTSEYNFFLSPFWLLQTYNSEWENRQTLSYLQSSLLCQTHPLEVSAMFLFLCFSLFCHLVFLFTSCFFLFPQPK